MNTMSLQNTIAAIIVKTVHLALVLFMVIVPFTNSEFFLTIHAIGLPGLLIHWITNNNVCSLTLLEAKLTGSALNQTFIGKIVHPFFEINNYTIYTIVFGLWFLTLYKLYPTRFRMLRAFLWITWYQIVSLFERFVDFFSFEKII